MAKVVALPRNLSFEVDTWMNTDTEQGVNIAEFTGGSDNNLAFNNGSILADGTTVSGTATLIWDPVNGASFTTNGLLTDANFTNVATTFNANDTLNFGFSARVGGANETLLIDDLRIQTVPEPSGVALLGLAGLGLIMRRRR